MVYYPGTQTPMDFVSRIEVEGQRYQVSMNHIADVRHYRFYQSAYDEDGRGTILSVSFDPWGIGVTYVGYGLLFFSMILLLVLPNEGFRRALRRVSVVGLLLWSCGTYAVAAPRSSEALPPVVPDSVAQQFCDLYCYYNGRICPLQTVARDFTTMLYALKA